MKNTGLKLGRDFKSLKNGIDRGKLENNGKKFIQNPKSDIEMIRDIASK